MFICPLHNCTLCTMILHSTPLYTIYLHTAGHFHTSCSNLPKNTGCMQNWVFSQTIWNLFTSYRIHHIHDILQPWVTALHTNCSELKKHSVKQCQTHNVKFSELPGVIESNQQCTRPQYEHRKTLSLELQVKIWETTGPTLFFNPDIALRFNGSHICKTLSVTKLFSTLHTRAASQIDAIHWPSYTTRPHCTRALRSL